MDKLFSGERLLLKALRQIALFPRECRPLSAAFEEACGYAGVEALRALEVFVLGLAVHGRRRIELNYPTVSSVSSDERLILEIFGGVQAEAYASAEGGLLRLMGAEPNVLLMSAAALVAQALELQGLMIRTEGEADEAALAQCTAAHRFDPCRSARAGKREWSDRRTLADELPAAL